MKAFWSPFLRLKAKSLLTLPPPPTPMTSCPLCPSEESHSLVILEESKFQRAGTYAEVTQQMATGRCRLEHAERSKHIPPTQLKFSWEWGQHIKAQR